VNRSSEHGEGEREESLRSLPLVGTRISPFSRNDRKEKSAIPDSSSVIPAPYMPWPYAPFVKGGNRGFVGEWELSFPYEITA
jgi:hypothetical protein